MRSRQWVAFALIFSLLLNGFSSVSAATPAKIVVGVVSNVVSALAKWLWSLKSNPEPGGAVSRKKGLKGADVSAVPERSMVKFEDGYSIETVFDGSDLGIQPFSVVVSSTGDLMVLDSDNSNIYKIHTPLTKYSRPKLVAGSSGGYRGHVDGKLREARMNQPKGLAVDERGNIYIADTNNMAIRKISEAGVTTIAGGKWSRGAGHVDGPSEDAILSNDFDVRYVTSSCSLLVVDRGNRAIREIQLHDEDCNNQDDTTTSLLGIAMVGLAVFLGYMLALLKWKVQSYFSPRHFQMFFNVRQEQRTYSMKNTPMTPYQRPPQSVIPPLISNEDEHGFGMRQPLHYQFQQQYQQQEQLKHLNTWPMQDSYVIPDEDVPPPVESRYPTPKKARPLVTKELQKNRRVKSNQTYHRGWEGDYHQQQQIEQHHSKYVSSSKTEYEDGCETNGIVFGAVKEQDGRREAVMIKAVDYADRRYNHRNIRPRYNYVGYSHAYL
ncbi:Protein SUPPRESSOR OF QUENCHING 1, chloroplastic [Linum perenne]